MNVKLVNNLQSLLKSASRHRFTTAMLILTALATLFAVYIWRGYILVDVTVSQPQGTSRIELFTNDFAGQKSIGNAGVHLIPRDKPGLIARAGANIRTQTMIDAKWYEFFITKHIELKRDRDAEKIGFKSSLDNPCGTYSKQLDRMLQYACGNTNTLVHYSTPTTGDWGTQVITPGGIFYPDTAPVPYMGGIIGIPSPQGDGEPTIRTTNDTGQTRNYPIPTNSDGSNIAASAIATDQNDLSNNRFVIVTQKGTIYLASPNSNNTTVEYRKITAPRDYDTGNWHTLCLLKGATVTCYRGPTPSDHPSIDSKKSPEIIRFSFENDTADAISVADVRTVEILAQTNDGHLYIQRNSQLFSLELSEGKYHMRELSRSVSKIVGSDQLYYIQDDGVFAVDPKTQNSYQVFYSLGIEPTGQRIMAAGGSVFIFGQFSGDGSATYAWRLTKEFNANYGSRLIDVLPISSSPGTYCSVDLAGKSIYLTPTFDANTTANDIPAQKKRTLEYLAAKGVNLDQVTVVNP